MKLWIQHTWGENLPAFPWQTTWPEWAGTSDLVWAGTSDLVSEPIFQTMTASNILQCFQTCWAPQIIKRMKKASKLWTTEDVESGSSSNDTICLWGQFGVFRFKDVEELIISHFHIGWSYFAFSMVCVFWQSHLPFLLHKLPQELRVLSFSLSSVSTY